MAQPSSLRFISEAALAVSQALQDTNISNHETRIDAVEVLGGLAPGDVSDATITSIVANPASTSSVELKKRHPVKGEVAILASDYGVIGDGVADDTANLQAAFTAAAGKTLILGNLKRYKVTASIASPKNVTLVSNGSKFVKAAASTSWAFITDDGFQADAVDVETPGHATTSDQGAYIVGSNIRIGRLKVVSLQGDTPGNFGVQIGAANAVTTTAKTNVRIDRIEIKGFQKPCRVMNLQDSCLSNWKIENHIVGIYIQNNVQNVGFVRGTITGTSAASAAGPYNGMNGVLIEGVADYITQNLRFHDFVVDGSPEHSYRIGGFYSVRDVLYDNCISRNSGNAPGNVSTGGGGFKALGGTVNNWHDNIRYINCVVEDCNTDGNGTNNFTAFSFGFVRGVVIENPTVKARNKTYSCQVALYLNSVENFSITNPDFMGAKSLGVFIGKDGTDSSLTGVKDIRVQGGRIGAALNHALYFDTQGTPTRNVSFDGVGIVGNTAVSRAVRAETVTGAGIYDNIRLNVRYKNVATIGSEPPLLTQPEFRIQYEGPVYGYTMSAANGSTMVNTDTGAFMLRKAGAWSTL